MTAYSLGFTEKIRLNRVIDPLGLRSLKSLEDYFLEGITTQTQRLRYYTFFSWVYDKIGRGDFDSGSILQMEKVFTLIAQNHHMGDRNAPRGIRNTESASKFLLHRESVNINELKKFGVGGRNRVGYGEYYYRNPLQILNIFKQTDEGKISSTEIGKEIAKTFDTIGKTEPFIKTKFSKSQLSRLHSYCLCKKEISKKEQHLWRLIFFGFTNVNGTNNSNFDFHAYEEFLRGKMRIPKWHAFNIPSTSDYLMENLPKFHADESLSRRYTLLLIMKIIDEANPDDSNLNQTIRDAIYFGQVYKRNKRVKEIKFGKLENFRGIWEVYVHNLYYISVLEGMFHIMLNILESKPHGASLEHILADVKTEKILNFLTNYGVKADEPKFEDLLLHIQRTLRKQRSNLREKLNERDIFLHSQVAKTTEERLADFWLLLALLKYRHDSFDEKQYELLKVTEEDLLTLSPRVFCNSFYRCNLSSFLKNTFKLLKDRHRLVSSRKYLSGTKSWLMTEENDVLFHYGKEYQWNPYREAKWMNVVELLYDMDLLEKDGEFWKTTELGKIWLRKIM